MMWVSVLSERLVTDYFYLNNIDFSNDIVLGSHRCRWIEDADNCWWQNEELGDKFWLYDIIANMVTVKSFS